MLNMLFGLASSFALFLFTKLTNCLLNSPYRMAQPRRMMSPAIEVDAFAFGLHHVHHGRLVPLCGDRRARRRNALPVAAPYDTVDGALPRWTAARDRLPVSQMASKPPSLQSTTCFESSSERPGNMPNQNNIRATVTTHRDNKYRFGHHISRRCLLPRIARNVSIQLEASSTDALARVQTYRKSRYIL